MTSDTQVTGRPLRADARRNRARILEAAEVVFASRGSGAGIDEVAAEAGLGVGTLYRHFPTKEALISAILFERVNRLIDAGEIYLEVEDPADGLYQFLSHLVDESVAKQDLTDALAGSMPPGEFPAEMLEVVARLSDLTSRLLARAQLQGGIRDDVTTADLIAMVVGPCMACGSPLVATPSPHKMLAVIYDGLRLGTARS